MPVTVRNGSTTGMVRYVLRTFRSNMPNNHIWYLISFYYRLKCSITIAIYFFKCHKNIQILQQNLSSAKQQRGLHIFMTSAYFCGMPHFLGSLLSVKVLTLGINCPHKYLPLAVDLSVQGYELFLICIATFRVVCLDEHNVTIAFGQTYVWKSVLW